MLELAALARVAAFDLDGTLTTRDCVVPFLREVAGSRRLSAGLARRAHVLAPALVRRDRDRVKALATAAVFAGRAVADVEAIGKRFATHVLDAWMRADTVATLEQHRRSGDRVVVVSASYALYVRPLAAELGAEHVIATELAVGPDRCYTGALDGRNCRGAVKVDRVHRWLDAQCGGRGAVELWAYGDSPGDRQMLADADHPVWVGKQ
jgi:phosphatidylglycerophosphatase C